MYIPYEMVEVPPAEPPGPARPPEPVPGDDDDLPPLEDEPDPIRDPQQDIPPLDRPEPIPGGKNPPMRARRKPIPEHLFSA